MSEEIKNEAVAESLPQISKSKAKREARKAEVKAEKTKKSFDSILAWVVGIVIAAVVIGVIVMGIISSANSTVASGDYSEGLSKEGFINGAKLSKVKDLDLKNLKVALSDVEFTDEDVENDIQSVLSNASYFDDDASLTVKDGDTISLDYVGSIDGVEFDGGNTNGMGTTLVIGSQTYIDTFEEQLIGSHPGDSVTVNVTFPEPYDNNPDLAGKPAVFECVVNAIRITPEFTDEFVKENFSELASTTEELRAYAKESGSESNLKTYLSDYIADNAEVSAYPSAYLKHVKALLKYTEQQQYEYYNDYYYSYLGSYLYNSFEEYTGMTESEYEAHITETAKSQVASDMTYEAIFKDNNLSIDDELYTQVVALYGGEGNVASYGEEFLHQVAIKYAVLNYLAEVVTVQ